MDHPRPLIRLFSSFQTDIKTFTTNKYEKMSSQYTVPGIEPTTFGTWVSAHDHPNRTPETFLSREQDIKSTQPLQGQIPQELNFEWLDNF